MNYREYLAKIGSKGGKKSRRKLTKKQAREMAQKRWAEVQPEVGENCTTGGDENNMAKPDPIICEYCGEEILANVVHTHRIKTDAAPQAQPPPAVSSGEWVECPCCSGTSHVLMPPYYATQMPEPRPCLCEECGGHGRFFVIPDNCFTIRESEARRHSTVGMSHGGNDDEKHS